MAEESIKGVALVTGAGSGIGAALAWELASMGYAVALVGRDESKLGDVAQQIRREVGPRVVETDAFPADITDPAQCERVVEQVRARWGRLDVLANVAGWATLATLADTTPQMWDKLLATNLSGPFHLTRAAWPLFAERKSGFVVNISSMASHDPFPGLGGYAVAKIGLNMLTLMTAREGAAIGLRAVSIAPGAVETPMLRGLFSTAELPPGAAMSPRKVARLACDCLDGHHFFEPGQTIYMTGR